MSHSIPNNKSPITENKRRRSISLDLSECTARFSAKLSPIHISHKSNSVRARKPKSILLKQSRMTQLQLPHNGSNSRTFTAQSCKSLVAMPRVHKPKKSRKKRRSKSISMNSSLNCNEKMDGKPSKSNRRHSDNDYQRKKIRKLRKQNKHLSEENDQYRDQEMLFQIEKKQFDHALNAAKNDKQIIRKLETELKRIKKDRVEEKRKLQQKIDSLTAKVEVDFDASISTMQQKIDELNEDNFDLNERMESMQETEGILHTQLQIQRNHIDSLNKEQIEWKEDNEYFMNLEREFEVIYYIKEKKLKQRLHDLERENEDLRSEKKWKKARKLDFALLHSQRSNFQELITNIQNSLQQTISAQSNDIAVLGKKNMELKEMKSEMERECNDRLHAMGMKHDKLLNQINYYKNKKCLITNQLQAVIE